MAVMLVPSWAEHDIARAARSTEHRIPAPTFLETARHERRNALRLLRPALFNPVQALPDDLRHVGLPWRE
jgi:hypothetical protein